LSFKALAAADALSPTTPLPSLTSEQPQQTPPPRPCSKVWFIHMSILHSTILAL
jgi:hypothetical protein